MLLLLLLLSFSFPKTPTTNLIFPLFPWHIVTRCLETKTNGTWRRNQEETSMLGRKKDSVRLIFTVWVLMTKRDAEKKHAAAVRRKIAQDKAERKAAAEARRRGVGAGAGAATSATTSVHSLCCCCCFCCCCCCCCCWCTSLEFWLVRLAGRTKNDADSDHGHTHKRLFRVYHCCSYSWWRTSQFFYCWHIDSILINVFWPIRFKKNLVSMLLLATLQRGLNKKLVEL